MGCATESLCWSEPQQVNIFSARGGASWAEPVRSEMSRGLRAAECVSFHSAPADRLAHWYGDTWISVGARTHRPQCGLTGGLARDLAMRSLKETNSADIRKTHPCATAAPHPDVLVTIQSLASRSFHGTSAWVRSRGCFALLCAWGFGAQLCNETIGNYQVDLIDT